MPRRKNYQGELVAIEKKKRQDRIEKLLVTGETNRTRIAARLGFSVAMVAKDVKEIYDRWRESEVEGRKLDQQRLDAIQRYENIFREEMNSFTQSKQTEEHTSTTHTSVECPECKGTGEVEEWPCIACNGVGRQIKEATIRRVIGKPGDPAFHKVAMEANKEICRLRGMGEKTQGAQTQVNVAVVRDRGEIDWDSVPLDVLQRYRKTHAEVLGYSKKKDKGANVVDVDSKNGRGL